MSINKEKADRSRVSERKLPVAGEEQPCRSYKLDLERWKIICSVEDFRVVRVACMIDLSNNTLLRDQGYLGDRQIEFRDCDDLNDGWELLITHMNGLNEVGTTMDTIRTKDEFQMIQREGKECIKSFEVIFRKELSEVRLLVNGNQNWRVRVVEMEVNGDFHQRRGKRGAALHFIKVLRLPESQSQSLMMDSC